jgi:hypothetical protein
VLALSGYFLVLVIALMLWRSAGESVIDRGSGFENFMSHPLSQYQSVRRKSRTTMTGEPPMLADITVAWPVACPIVSYSCTFKWLNVVPSVRA